MKLETILEIYDLMARANNGKDLQNTIKLRKKALEQLQSSLVKVAFDTRKINQETDYIPRRGLQNYHRSENFISEQNAAKLKAFAKLSGILDKLKENYGKEPAWNDSYTRVLHASVFKTLHANDASFSDAQPSMTSLNYLEELMFVRYRLTPDNILALSEEDLRNKILSKDESLLKEGFLQNKNEFVPSDVSKYSYDQMVDKMLTSMMYKSSTPDFNKYNYEQMVDKMLSTMTKVMTSFKVPSTDDNLTNKLFDVKATQDNPEVERTVTITIKDKIEKNSAEKGTNEPSTNSSSSSKNGDAALESKSSEATSKIKAATEETASGTVQADVEVVSGLSEIEST